mgnify:CR=1 FL=1
MKLRYKAVVPDGKIISGLIEANEIRDAAEYLREKNGINEFNRKYTFYYSGFNFRPTEIQGFLGLIQLEKLDKFIAARKQTFDYYNYAIRNDYWKPSIPSNDYVSNLGYPLITPKRSNASSAYSLHVC